MKKTLFLSAILATALCSSAFGASLTTDTSVINGVTYNGGVYSIAGPTEEFHSVGKTADVDSTSGDIKQGSSPANWHIFASNQDLDYGHTVHLKQTGTYKTNFSPFTFGGLIVDKDADGIVLGRTNTQIEINGANSVNMDIKSNTQILGGNASVVVPGYSGSGMVVLKGGTWNVASDKTLTLTANNNVITIDDSVAINVTGGGTLKLDTTTVNFANISETANQGNGFGAYVVNHQIATGNVDASKVTTWKVNGQNTTGLQYDNETNTVSGSITSTNYYVNESGHTISATDLAQASSVVLNSATAASATGAGLGSLTSITLNGSSSVLDLTGTAVEQGTIKNLLLGAQGEGLLKIKTGRQHWFHFDNVGILNVDADITGQGLEIDGNSLTVAADKTLTVHGKMQFEGGGKLTINGTLDNTGDNAYLGLGHADKNQGNVVVDGAGLLKVTEIHNIRTSLGWGTQTNTLLLQNGGSLQVTGAALIGGTQTEGVKTDVTVTDGKLIADGNNWTLNTAATIGTVQVLGANTVTLDNTVTFSEGATVTVGSEDKAGNLTISGTVSGAKAAVAVNTASTLTLSANVAIGGLTQNGGTVVVENGKTLTVSALTAATGTIQGTGKLLIETEGTYNNTTLDFDTFSTTEQTTIAFHEAHGTLEAASSTVQNDIELTNGNHAAAEWNNVKGTSYTFSGSFTGSGNLSFNGTNGEKDVDLTFTGDLSGWNSPSKGYNGLRASGGMHLDVTIGGSQTTAVANAFNADSVTNTDTDKGGGTMNLTVSRDATLNGSISVNTLTVGNGKSVSTTHRNVMVQDAIILGTGSSLTFGAASGTQTTGTLTLNSGSTLTIGSAAEGEHNFTLTTSGLTVNGNAAINADLVMNSGTLTFADNATLTMGCDVTIGDAVTVVLTDTMIDTVHNTGSYDLFESVGTATLGNVTFVDKNGTTLGGYNLKQIGDKIVVAPEPATATLSLLALAALCARRKRH